MSTNEPIDVVARAEEFIRQDDIHEPMHDRFLWAVMRRRGAEAAALPEWEQLRELASHIKEHTLTHLDEYLTQFEANATRRGAQVHWARDAAEHNEIVYDILRDHDVTALIKSKSMLQEECVMTPYLETRGITVTESDLGERIQRPRLLYIAPHTAHIAPAQPDEVSHTALIIALTLQGEELLHQGNGVLLSCCRGVVVGSHHWAAISTTDGVAP